MPNYKKLLIVIIPLIILVSFFLYFKNAESPIKSIPPETTGIIDSTKKTETAGKKQLILIGIDGMQISRYNELLLNGDLPNFNKIIQNGGENNIALITGHINTSTAPGNAELLTGLNSSLTKITDNSCNTVIPKGKTIFERLAFFDSQIVLGSIYGKETCYIPLSLLSNAKPVVSWWQDNSTYDHKKYAADACADSTDVMSKSLEFIQKNKDDSFYLFIYLGAPDCTGHTFGLPSLEYDKSIFNVDNGLGILLNGIDSYLLKPEIIISGDHGWNSSSNNHNVANEDTQIVGLITNNHTLIDKTQEKKQCDIVPTILSYFGMNSNQFIDITQTGCNSLIKL